MSERTIVIADDDGDLVAALKRRCEAFGLRVYPAYDALDALNLIHYSEPDLVCLDVNMPCGNGLSVLEMLANDEDLCSIPVIIMTGESCEEVVRHCHQRAAYYVEKSVDVWSRLYPLIEDILSLPEPTCAHQPS